MTTLLLLGAKFDEIWGFRPSFLLGALSAGTSGVGMDGGREAWPHKKNCSPLGGDVASVFTNVSPAMRPPKTLWPPTCLTLAPVLGALSESWQGRASFGAKATSSYLTLLIFGRPKAFVGHTGRGSRLSSAHAAAQAFAVQLQGRRRTGGEHTVR